MVVEIKFSNEILNQFYKSFIIGLLFFILLLKETFSFKMQINPTLNVTFCRY